jgi:nucleoside 2-deoxyribosyltransferase
MKIYLAGPLGFSQAGREFYRREIVDKIRALGHVPLDPWDDKPPPGINRVLAAEIEEIAKKIHEAEDMPYGPEKRDTWRALNMRIGAKNSALIDEADMVFAVLDGTDVDSGTAAEIGYAFAKGKSILGYRGDFRLSADNAGATVNLQVEYFIRARDGSEIFTDIKLLGDKLARFVAAGAKKAN